MSIPTKTQLLGWRQAFDAIAARLEQAAEVAHEAFRAIDYPVARVRRLLEQTSPYIRVANDWSVTIVLPDPPPELVAEAENLWASLTDLVRAAGEADARAAGLVELLLSGLGEVVPERLSIGGDTGAEDARAVVDDSANPEMLARIEAATELTASQWERLSHGERIDLPQGQFDYLVSFMGALDRVPLDQLAGFGSGDTDLRAALADGIQIMSNPNIGTFQELAGDAAAPTGASAQDIIDADRAGRTADSLAHTLADGSVGFVDVPAMSGASIGEINGGLTQSLSGAMAPYLGTFVGAPDEFTNTRGAESFTDGAQVAAMLEVLNSNHDAGLAINTKGIDLYGEFAQEFGRDTSDNATQWGQYSGRMVNAMVLAAEAHDQGVHSENHGEAIDVGERKSFGSENMAALVSTFPIVGGPGAGLLDSYNNFLNNPTPNPYDTPGDSAQSDLIDRMLTDRRLYGNVADGLSEVHEDDAVASAARSLADNSAEAAENQTIDIASRDRRMHDDGILFDAFRGHVEHAGRYGWTDRG